MVAVTISEYLDPVYRPDCEYIDGGLLERNVGEWDHSRMLGLLAISLTNREKEWGVLGAIASRVQVGPTRFRIPDITVVTAPPKGGIIQEPPFLCVEILSPRDRMAEMQDRIDDYLAFGVRYVWVIHPETRRAFVYTVDGMHEAKDRVLSTVNPDIRVVLSELETE